MAKHIEKVLREVFAGLCNHKRWKTLDDPQRETVAEHAFKQGVITLMMLRMEQHLGNPHRLDCFEILACAIMHDVGEAIVGDTPRLEKTGTDDDQEAQAFEQIIGELVPKEIRHLFPQPLDRSAPEGDINREFWDDCERMGYLLYSSYQVDVNPQHQAGCIDHQLPALRNSRFDSVRLMLIELGYR